MLQASYQRGGNCAIRAPRNVLAGDSRLSAYANCKMSPCSTKPRFAIGLSKGLSWQGRRLALSRCIPLAAASLHKPTTFLPDKLRVGDDFAWGQNVMGYS